MPKKNSEPKKDKKPDSPELKLRKIIRAEIAKLLFTLFQKRKMWMS